MPVMINEVITEVEASPEFESQPVQGRAPVSDPEFALLKMLTLMEERRLRLKID
jgi:hypothetical protein